MVFSLNDAVAELSRDESAGQAHLIVDTIGNVIGVEEIVPMAGYGQKEDELDGSINCKPLIDGLLMKLFHRNKNRWFILLNQKAHLRQDCLSLIVLQDGTSFC